MRLKVRVLECFFGGEKAQRFRVDLNFAHILIMQLSLSLSFSPPLSLYIAKYISVSLFLPLLQLPISGDAH